MKLYSLNWTKRVVGMLKDKKCKSLGEPSEVHPHSQPRRTWTLPIVILLRAF